MLDVLHISSLRHGADGNASSPYAANYDDSKAGSYSKLPDALLTNSGRAVTTVAQWWKVRRPEIVEQFSREVYGRVPAHLPPVKWEVVSTTPGEDAGIAVNTKKLVGHIKSATPGVPDVNMEMTLTTPAHGTHPVAVVMEFAYTFPAGFRPPAAAPAEPTWQQQVLARGWGYAEFYPTTVQADSGGGLNEGIIGIANRGRPRSCRHRRSAPAALVMNEFGRRREPRTGLPGD